MTSNKILVIGGGGYIGEHLTSLLIARGREVTILGRSVTPRYKLPEGGVYISGDFCRHDLICHLLDSHQEIIHLAYATVPNASVENTWVDFSQNVSPAMQLFVEAAERNRKLVLVSSGGTVYGEAVSLPIREDHPTHPISPYGVTKLTLENYAYLYSVTHGLKFICVRPANAYGVGQRPFLGQGFISTAMGYVMRGQPIPIFGKTGTIRDYIYVSDLASGIVSALESGNLSETYNLGSGLGLTNKEVIQALSPQMQKMGFEVRVEYLPERTFDVKANVLDSSKIRAHTGWSAQIDLHEGLALTLEWLRSCSV